MSNIIVVVLFFLSIFQVLHTVIRTQTEQKKTPDVLCMSQAQLNFALRKKIITKQIQPLPTIKGWAKTTLQK